MTLIYSTPAVTFVVMDSPLSKLLRTSSTSSGIRRHEPRTLDSDTDQFPLEEIYTRVINNASVILPETGEASSQYFTLVQPNSMAASVRSYSMEDEGLVRRVLRQVVEYLSPYLCQDVLKCSTAYFIASLAVYFTPIANLLGSSDSKHLVATVAVYFHPSRTIGLMHQSIVFIVISLSFSFFVSLLCSVIASSRGETELSYVVNVVVISVALSIVSVVKQKISKQTFNVACSLASTSLISTIVKEGSHDNGHIKLLRLHSVFLIVVFGALVSVIICYSLWPQSAVIKLKLNLNTSYYLMSDSISLLSDRFLSGEEAHMVAITKIQDQLKVSLKVMKNYLEEAKFELLVQGKEKEYGLLVEMCSLTQTLTRSLAGLKLSADIQNQLLQESMAKNAQSINNSLSEAYENINIFGKPPPRRALTQAYNDPDIEQDEDIIDSSQLFNLFIYYLGPPLKSFSFTIKEILDHVPFDQFEPHAVVNTAQYARSLHLAQELLKSKQLEAMAKVYSEKLFNLIKGEELKADEEEVAASCFNFSYSLIEYSHELNKVFDILDAYALVTERGCPKTYGWLRFWKSKPEAVAPVFQKDPWYSTNLNKFRYRAWKFFSLLRGSDFQFGIRVGIGALVLSLFAFIPQTREFFASWRLEWSLVIYSIMMNKSMGGTQMTVKWRIFGTFIGALTAVLTWELFQGEAWGQAIVGFLISIPSFYIILKWAKFNAYGRFILLTYNLTALYSYSMTQDEEEDDREGGNSPVIYEIGFHRFISVSIGVVWAIFITTFILPHSARARLKRGLSLLWLQLGIIWNSDPLKHEKVSEQDQKYLVGIQARGFKVYELFSELETFCNQAPMEFRLKGPFPTDIYKSILGSTEVILNAIDNANMIISENPQMTPGRHLVMDYIKTEREELESRILQNFYMIASAMRLGMPLPLKGISTAHSKDRILAKLAEVRRDQKQNQNTVEDDDFALFYSYFLISCQITQETDLIIDLIQELFGKVTPEELEF